jgi:hypothetical protein
MEGRETAMTGPDHFREAERLLGSLEGMPLNERRQREEGIVAEAQVHAILALTAANALAAITPLSPPRDLLRRSAGLASRHRVLRVRPGPGVLG